MWVCAPSWVQYCTTARSTIGTRIASLRWKPGYSGRPPPGPPHISWWLGAFSFGHLLTIWIGMRSTFPKGENIEPFFCRTPAARYLISQHFVHHLKQVNGLKTREGKTFRNLNLRHSNESKFAKKMDPESPCSDHSSTGAITCALCRARGTNCLKSKHCISSAIVAFTLAIAWSASFVSYPARLDPACWGLRVGMKRLDPVHGLAVEEEFLNMESMKTLRSKTLRKPLHILKSNANQPIEKMKEKTGGRKRLQPSMKTVAWPCPDSFFSTLVQIPDPGHILVSSSCSRISDKPVKFKI